MDEGQIMPLEGSSVLPEFRMVVTDVDGTILGATVREEDVERFHETLNSFRRRYNAIWVVITGRSIASYEAISSRVESSDCRPDFVIVRNTTVYVYSKLGYRPHLPATGRLKWFARQDRRQVKKAMQGIRHAMRRTLSNVRMLGRDEGGIVYQLRNPEDVSVAVDLIKPLVTDVWGLKVLVHTNEVEIVPVYYQKGHCIRAVAELVHASADQILSIADGRRDLSMVDPLVAAYAGCPSNAVPEMRSYMHQRSGILAAGATLRGVCEILDIYVTDGMVPVMPTELPKDQDVKHPWGRLSLKRQPGRRRREYVMVGAGCYAILASLAHFGVVPGASIILLPFSLLKSLFGG